MYREWKRQAGDGFDADAVAYFTAASITSATEKSAANTIIVGLKAEGIWDSMSRIYLRSPTSLAACLMCCKSLTSQTAVNSPSFNSYGLAYNGTTQYARCTIGPSDASEVTTDSSTIAMYMNQGDAIGNYMVGSKSKTDTDFMFLKNGVAV